MRCWLLCLVVAALLVSLAVETYAQEPGHRLAKWTIMVYMDADNDLGHWAKLDINEMEAVADHPDINILVQRDTRSGPAFRYKIKHDASPDTSTVTSSYEHELGEVNMGEVITGVSSTLSDFVNWATGAYPADHYCLVFWDHGNGWREETDATWTGRGVGGDWNSGGDGITVCDGELAEVLSMCNEHLDVVAFDACLMGMVEVAHACAGEADIMVASELIVGYTGFPYRTWLSKLEDEGGNLDPVPLANALIDNFCPSFTQSAHLAGWSLSETGNLLTALDNFANELLQEIGNGHELDIHAARLAAQEIYVTCLCPANVGKQPVHVDLRDFAAVVSLSPWATSALKSDALDVLYAIDTNPLHLKRCDNDASLSEVNFLAIYYPDGITCCYDPSYTPCGFSGDSRWDDFIRETVPTLGEIDLQVVRMTPLPHAWPILNAPVTVEIEVENKGTGASKPNTLLDFYYHSTSAPGCNTAGNETFVLPVIAAGATTTVTTSAFTCSAVGTQRAWACVDRSDINSELCEQNMWGPCDIYWLDPTPVEATLQAAEAAGGAVSLRWTIVSLSGIEGLNVYRSIDQSGPFELLNEEPLAAAASGVYLDTTVWPETTFWYRVTAIHADGSEEDVVKLPVFVKTGGTPVTRLYDAAPNPFTGETALAFEVPSQVGPVRVAIYDVRGRLVKTLVDRPMDAGRHTLRWTGTNEHGTRVASGVYFVKLEIAGEIEAKKMTFLK